MPLLSLSPHSTVATPSPPWAAAAPSHSSRSRSSPPNSIFAVSPFQKSGTPTIRTCTCQTKSKTPIATVRTCRFCSSMPPPFSSTTNPQSNSVCSPCRKWYQKNLGLCLARWPGSRRWRRRWRRANMWISRRRARDPPHRTLERSWGLRGWRWRRWWTVCGWRWWRDVGSGGCGRRCSWTSRP